MSLTAPPVVRHYHADLQPLKTHPSPPIYLQPNPSSARPKSSTQSFGSTTPATPKLPSPSIVAARAWYRENAAVLPQIGHVDTQARLQRIVPSHGVPRRHSMMPRLATQLESFSFQIPVDNDLTALPEPRIKIETETEDVEIVRSAISEGRKKSTDSAIIICGAPQELRKQVPWQYTHDHLRDWGYIYLGNFATADALVNAVSMRRPSLAFKDNTENDNEGKEGREGLVTIRARIRPRTGDRKPFIIQRNFDMEELRRGMPSGSQSRSLSPVDVGKGRGRNGSSSSSKSLQMRLRRSERIRRSSYGVGESGRRRGSAGPENRKWGIALGDGAVPIHIEYALHYLPVLAALMLSGHVRKGDEIDLPIPHPGVWNEVVGWVYTGRCASGWPGEVSQQVREVVEFLGGGM